MAQIQTFGERTVVLCETAPNKSLRICDYAANKWRRTGGICEAVWDYAARRVVWKGRDGQWWLLRQRWIWGDGRGARWGEWKQFEWADEFGKKFSVMKERRGANSAV